MSGRHLLAGSQFRIPVGTHSRHPPTGDSLGRKDQKGNRKKEPLRFPDFYPKLQAKDRVEEYAEWVSTAPGDCVIFDPRVLHTGSDFEGTKYSFFVAYGIENEHFNRHYSYYRMLRTDLNYKDFAPALEARLKDAGLLPEGTPSDEEIEGAWIPSKAFTMVAKQFK